MKEIQLLYFSRVLLDLIVSILICLHVHLPVMAQFFSELTQYIFMILCMKL